MRLFPKSGEQYFSTDDIGIQQRMDNFYRESISNNQAFWGEADIDTRFESGDQQVFTDLYGAVPLSRRKNFTFNRIRRVVNMISGYQRRNRKSTVVIPVENADEQTADQFSKILSWCNQQEGVLNTVSESFHGAIVTGMNLMQVWMDYRSDPVSGNIRVDNCNYNSFLIDPFFRKADLSDCKGLWKRSYLTKREVASLLPDYKNELQSLTGGTVKDGKFQFLPENYVLNRKDLLSYDEFYYRDYRSQRMLADMETGETLEWRGQDEDALRRYLQIYPQITVLEQEIPTVKMAIVVEGKVFFDDLNPLGTDLFPFVPVFGYYTPQLPDYSTRIQGVVRGMRDPQYLYNRRKIIECDVAESKATTGWIAKANAAVDPKDLLKTGQGRTIFLKQTAQMTDIAPIPTQDVPPGFFTLSRDMAKEIDDDAGATEELLGSSTENVSGLLAMLRQGRGLTTLQPLFDQLDQSQKLLGKLMIDVIQSNFAPGKVKRIIEEEPSPQFYNKAFGKYDAAIEEGLNTTTQRQNQFAQLLHLKETGIPIPDDVIINAATIQNKKELTDAIKQSNEKKAEAEQMQMQIALKEQEARTNLANKRAFADESLGVERLSRVEENKEFVVERHAEAQKDRTQAFLNLVKAFQEIDTRDVDYIERLLRLSDIADPHKTQHELPQPGQPGQTGLSALQGM